MRNRVRVGISGLGRSGWDIHANALERCSGTYSVVAVSDPIEERRNDAINRFGCRAYSDFSSFLKDDEVELAVIATPSHLHASQTIKALRAGKNVVCEKPMATNLMEADMMIRVARETKRILTVFQNKRYSPDFLKVREVVESGKLGRIVLVKMRLHSFGRRWDWQTLKRFGGGELNNNASHLIDQAIQLIGDDMEVAFCDLRRTLTLGDAEDHVKIILKASDSAIVDIEITHACAYPENYWLVMGTQGGLTGNNNSIQWKYFEPKDLPPRQVEVRPTPDRSYNWEEVPWKEEMWSLDESSKRGEVLFYEELYRTIREGSPLGVTPESVRKAMYIIEKCREYCVA